MFARNRLSEETIYATAKQIVAASGQPALGFCYMALAERLAGRSTAAITNTQLGGIFHVHPRTASRYADKLCELGYLTKTVTRSGNRNLPNIYGLIARPTDKKSPQPAKIVPFNGKNAHTRSTNHSAMMNDDDDKQNSTDNHNHDPQQTTNAQLLAAIGVDAPVCYRFDHIPAETVQAWINHTLKNPALKNPAAFVVSKLQTNAQPPVAPRNPSDSPAKSAPIIIDDIPAPAAPQERKDKTNEKSQEAFMRPADIRPPTPEEIAQFESTMRLLKAHLRRSFTPWSHAVLGGIDDTGRPVIWTEYASSAADIAGHIMRRTIRAHTAAAAMNLNDYRVFSPAGEHTSTGAAFPPPTA